MLTQSFKNYLVMLLNGVTVKIATLGFRKKALIDLTRLGTEYGGWWVPKNELANMNQKRVLISAGLGQDVSFDKAMLEHGFDLFGLDPLAASISFATNELANFSNKHILQVGLWVESGKIEFFSPKNPHHDSWSITNSQTSPKEKSETFLAISIAHLYSSYPRLREYDYVVLKMDIEGAEVPILLNLDFTDFRFNFLAIEIDYISMIPFRNLRERMRKIMKVRKMLHKIKNSGFELVFTENFNFFWTPKEKRL